jgi:Xaa-Pro aminopeptidase
MEKVQFLTKSEIHLNISRVKHFLANEGIDAYYFSSFDIFLNEYVPLEDSHRYYVTGFTGSTAEVILLKNDKVLLFVDGRYFEQADLEVDSKFVEVVKVDMNVGLRQSMLEHLEKLKIKKLGLSGDRTDLSLMSRFENVTNVIAYNHNEMAENLKLRELSFEKLIYEISDKLTGESTKDKLKRIVKPNEAIFLSSLDSIAWLTNLRRYELPNQSTFRAKALATTDRVYLLLNHIEGEIKNPAVEYYQATFDKITDFLTDLTLVNRLIDGKYFEIEKIHYDPESTNAADYLGLKKFFGSEKLHILNKGIVPFHALKNKIEIDTIKNSFNLADKAIFNTINWIKNAINENTKITELDFYNKCNEFYKAEGAFDQSFKTISGFGPNSSIIHFSNPSNNIIMTKNELALLDSGGYFDSGYATDTTRTFLTGGTASKKQKEIYTLVLKGFLHALNVVFPKGTIGAVVDGICRQPLYKAGYDYKHGTGHGVGINVHEGGFRISPQSTIPLLESTIGSIEPGIYIPGMGGVRTENIVLVKEHPILKEMLCFESLVYVGFDHALIEYSLLTKEEEVWLENYERECEKRGRSFKYPKNK